MIKTYIVAFELSHNNGLEDQHLPIKKNAWYWKVINDPNFAKASNSRNCAKSSLRVPAIDFIALICADPPTLDTEIPTSTAGRIPALNKSESKNI